MKKNKQQLIESANELAIQHQFKKDVIEKILNDFDSKEKISENDLDIIGTVQSLMTELKELEEKHIELVNKIKE